MKTLLVFISVLYLAHSFSLEDEKEALELLEQLSVRNAEILQAEDAVKEEARGCTHRGQKCQSDCDCCADDWDKCNFWGTCVAGTVNNCFDKQKNCNGKPKKCTRPGQNRRNQG
uniref:Cystine knot toxin n=1 Tax=Dolomedes mizhoanus TaxID=1366394 RepID=S5MK65_9ARAC|nr:cystine knot toxin [Dolomedes mizhoanus]